MLDLSQNISTQLQSLKLYKSTSTEAKSLPNPKNWNTGPSNHIHTKISQDIISIFNHTDGYSLKWHVYFCKKKPYN